MTGVTGDGSRSGTIGGQTSGCGSGPGTGPGNEGSGSGDGAGGPGGSGVGSGISAEIREVRKMKRRVMELSARAPEVRVEGRLDACSLRLGAERTALDARNLSSHTVDRACFF